MDSIDITDSNFSLNLPDSNEVINLGGGFSTDYTMYIYIGAAILLAIIIVYIYKYFQNKKNQNNQQLDCEGGFCTMKNMNPSQV
jgi:hypothetical protein